MNSIILSTKFQIVIPKEIRDLLKLESGAKLQVFAHQGRIEIVPEEPIKNLRGRYPKLTPFIREPDREL